MNTKRVILLGLLVMGVAAASYAAESGVAAPSYAAESGVAAASYAAESAPQGGATTGSLSAQGAAATMWQGVCDWICPSAYAADKGAAPVAYWRFDEAGGPTAYDESANNNDGTLTPGTLGTNTAAGQMWTRQGKIGGALECDGTDDYVPVGDKASLKGFNTVTAMAWIKITTQQTGGVLANTSGGYNLWYNNTSGIRAEVVVTGPAGVAFYGGLLPTGQWKHIAMTYDQQNLRLYIDGIQVNSVPETRALAAQDTGGFRIGEYAGYFNGQVDDVRIYNYSRTADQILVDYNAGSAAHLGAGTDPNEGNPPVGYWTFDENTGTTAFDRSGNGNDGTLTNGPTWTQGKNGLCVSFDGVNDYVNLPEPPEVTTNISIGSVFAWIKTNNAGSGYRGIVVKENSYAMYLLNNIFVIYDAGSGVARSTGINVADNQWHFVGFTFQDGITNGTKLYIDAIEKLTTTLNITTQSQGVVFGAGNNPGTAQFFNGLIDSVKIYNYARSAAQIAYDYSRGAPVAHYKFDEGGGAIAHNEYSSADSGSAPVGWWRMDEGTGTTTADGSGNGNTGTLNPGTLGTNTTAAGMWDQTGKIGPDCLEFDGTDDYVSASLYSSLQPTRATISFWWQAQSTAAYQYVIDTNSDSAGYGYNIQVNPGLTGFYVTFGNVGQDKFTSYTFTTGTWYYIAATYDGSNIVAYINGTQVNSFSIAGSPNILYSGGGFNIGRSNGNVYFAKGLIDDVRIYSYARTAEQIYNDYKTTHGTLVGDTKFVDGKIGKALSFDGTGDYVSVPDAAALDISTAGTVSFWYKRPSAGVQTTLGKWIEGTSQRAYELQENIDNKIYWNVSSTGSDHIYFTSTNTYTDTNWNHLAATFNGSTTTMKVYLNGVEIAGSITGTVPASLHNSSAPFETRYETQYTNGLIDDVRIYNYSRTAEQVMQDFNAGMATRLGAQSAGVADPWGGALPVAHWKMDENTGVLAFDASGNGNNGTLTNGPTWVQGKVGSTLSFDGSDDRVKVDHKDILNCTSGVTTEAWIYPTNIGGWQSIIDKRGDADTGTNYALMLNGDEVNFLFNTGTWHGFITSTANLTANNWYHVVASYDNATGYIYINGQSKSVTWNYGTQGTSLVNAASNDYLLIGFNVPNGSGQAFHGKIDDVRIYAYARTQAQIAWDYNYGKPVAHWRFDEGSGTTAYDESDNNNDGTITAATWSTSGKFGKCLNFDGTGDYVSMTGSYPTGTNPRTITAWVKSADTTFEGNADHVVNYGTALGSQAFGFMIHTGNQWRFYGHGGAYDFDTNISVDTNWHHHAITYDGSVVRYYYDGRQVATQSRTLSTTGGGFTVAHRPDLSVGNEFNGLIDDVRVYNYARTTSQIMEDYNQGMAVKLGD